jgi:carboxymethylenebutenolidase
MRPMQSLGLALGAAGAVALSSGAWRPSRPDIHAEYVKYASAGDSVRAYLAYPERRDAAPGIIVIHENTGLSDFARQTAEKLAGDGFVALAPDLLSRRGGTPASADSGRTLIRSLNPDTVTLDLNGAADFLKGLKAVKANRIGVIGFCWGGGQSFRYATNNPTLGAFVVCYGPNPPAADIARIRAPGLGAYAQNDARINAGLPGLDSAVKAAGTRYQYAIYPRVGHGFFRSRDDAAVADSAWGVVVQFLRRELDR